MESSYTGEEIVGKNDYKVRVKGKIRTYQHINLLKHYVQREEVADASSGKPLLEIAGAVGN